jgi:hypothetical protein
MTGHALAEAAITGLLYRSEYVKSVMLAEILARNEPENSSVIRRSLTASPLAEATARRAPTQLQTMALLGRQQRGRPGGRGHQPAAPLSPQQAGHGGAIAGRARSGFRDGGRFVRTAPEVLGDGRGPLVARGRSAGEGLGRAWPGRLRVACLPPVRVSRRLAMGVQAAA